MKTKHLFLGLAVMLVASTIWGVRTAWRVHHQLVTLDVREAPLIDVLRKIEWQTWKKIRAENSLQDVHVTLRVTNIPLPDVLNRLAAQAGARCSTLYAIYGSTRGLKALDSALRGDGQIEAAGWMRLNPPKVLSLVLPSGGARQVPLWPPNELMMEASLRARLGIKEAQRPTEEGAAELARKVNGKWTTYFEFTKSSTGVGCGIAASSKTNSTRTANGPNPNARFANLTPQQRVQQARRARGLPEK